MSDPPATATQGQSIADTSTIKNVGTVTATESTTGITSSRPMDRGRSDSKKVLAEKNENDNCITSLTP